MLPGTMELKMSEALNVRQRCVFTAVLLSDAFSRPRGLVTWCWIGIYSSALLANSAAAYFSVLRMIELDPAQIHYLDAVNHLGRKKIKHTVRPLSNSFHIIQRADECLDGYCKTLIVSVRDMGGAIISDFESAPRILNESSSVGKEMVEHVHFKTRCGMMIVVLPEISAPRLHRNYEKISIPLPSNICAAK